MWLVRRWQLEIVVNIRKPLRVRYVLDWERELEHNKPSSWLWAQAGQEKVRWCERACFLLTQPGTIEGIGLWRRAVTRPGAGGSGGDCFDALAAALLEPTALPELADEESPNDIRDLATELIFAASVTPIAAAGQLRRVY